MSQQSPIATSSAPTSPWSQSNGQSGFATPQQQAQQQQQQQQQQQGEPPAKRARLSPPTTTSPSPTPYATPMQYPQTAHPPYSGPPSNFRYPQLPQNAFAPRPFQQPMPNGLSASSPHASSVMGPPQRPVERAAPQQSQPAQVKEEREANFDAINDVALSSGIDITKEEDLLRYRSRQNTQYDMHGGGAFSLGDRGTFAQTPDKSQKDQLYENHNRAARRIAVQQAEHLNSPFFHGNVVRQKMTSISMRDFNLAVPLEGVHNLEEKYRDREHAGTSMTHAHDGSSIVSASLLPPSKINKGAPLEPMIALLSLAGSERLRGLLEDAYGLARARQMTVDGIVPPDWSDVAVGGNVAAEPVTTKPAAVTDSSWDRPPTPPDSSKGEEQQPTISFPASNNPITTALAALSRQDRIAEEARLKRRAERKARRAAETAESVAASLTNGAGPERGGTPVQEGLKLTKKERDKLARADLSEEAATRNANTTAQMQLGGKSYSWMSGGSKKKTQPKPAAMGSTAGLATAKAITGSAGAATAAAGGAGSAGGGGGGVASGVKAAGADRTGATGQDSKFGVWREDGVGGKGVQMRDWVAALEVDGHEKRTLENARAKLGREDTGS